MSEKFTGFTRDDLAWRIGARNFDEALIDEKRWLVFTIFWDDKKQSWRKVPVYETGDSFKFFRDKELTLDKCLSFQAARDFYDKRYKSRAYGQEIELYGLAFYLPGSKFSCIDIDYRYKAELVDGRYQWVKSGRCIDEQGNASIAAKKLFQSVGGWVEYSVSKKGYHIWYEGKSPLEERNFKFTYEGETIGGEWFDGNSPDNQIIALTGDYLARRDLL